MPAESASGQVVEVSIDISARPATVWRCLTQSDLLSRWLQARATVEPRVAGRVHINFGAGGIVEGQVQELDPEKVLAFTWGTVEGPHRDTIPPGSTLVRIQLADTAAGTRVTLRHEGLPDAEHRKDFTTGWTSLLGGLAYLAPSLAAQGGLEAMWDAWFAAWSDADAARRDERLARCFAKDGAFRDIHAEGRGREWLRDWIGQSQRYFPDFRLVRDGPVLQMRDAVLVRWRADSSDGKTVARGINYGRLTPQGTLGAVDGFWERGPK
jgi:uncharacterized protein YndB with AHSA1/START domain